MARIRTIKPDFWQHPIMGRLPDRTQLLAIALLNHSDDHGFFHAEPAIVRAACCPFREDVASVREDLASLSEVGWIELSKHKEQGMIGCIAKWSKHQRVDHASESKIKTYFTRENLANPREGLAPEQGTGNREQGTGNREVADAPAAPVKKIKKQPSPTPEDTFYKANKFRLKGSTLDRKSAIFAAIKKHGIEVVSIAIESVSDVWPSELIRIVDAKKDEIDQNNNPPQEIPAHDPGYDHPTRLPEHLRQRMF